MCGRRDDIQSQEIIYFRQNENKSENDNEQPKHQVKSTGEVVKLVSFCNTL